MKKLLPLLFIILLCAPSICRSSSVNIDEMKKLAESGNVDAQYEAGKWFLEHGNLQAAKTYLRSACRGKREAACELLKDDRFMKPYNIDKEKQDTKTLLDRAISLFEDKQYNLSFPIFKDLCAKGLEQACLNLGISYAYGLGTKTDTDEAKAIFQSNSHKDDLFKLEEARLLEYAEGGEEENIFRAMDIYKKLQNSSSEWIAKKAEEGLERLPIYILLNAFFPILGQFSKDNLNYESSYKIVHSLDTIVFPTDIAVCFEEMREVCWPEDENLSMGRGCNQRLDKLYNSAIEHEVSQKWINAKLKASFPK